MRRAAAASEPDVETHAQNEGGVRGRQGILDHLAVQRQKRGGRQRDVVEGLGSVGVIIESENAGDPETLQMAVEVTDTEDVVVAPGDHPATTDAPADAPVNRVGVLVGSAHTGEQTDALKVRDPVQEIEGPFSGFLGDEVLPRIPGHIPPLRMCSTPRTIEGAAAPGFLVAAAVMFGKVMATIEPRMAVGYHFFNDFDTEPIVEAQVRTTYNGPLALAKDYMVFNVTKDDIKVRMTAYDEAIWPLPATIKKLPPDRSQRIGFTKFLIDGRVVYADLIKQMYDDVNKEYGTNIPLPK